MVMYAIPIVEIGLVYLLSYLNGGIKYGVRVKFTLTPLFLHPC